MKKKITIIVATIFSFFVVGFVCLILYYNNALKAIASNEKDVKNITFTVSNGASSRMVVDQLYKEGLIKNNYVGYVYLFLNNDFVLQAGVYSLNTAMSFEEIIRTISSGDVIDNSISVTFIEGKRATNYAKVIAEKFGYSEEEVLNTINDKEYLQELIDNYWFLTEDILNDKLYYALEGYLAPNTYYFDKNASIKDIIERLLDATSNELKDYENDISNSEYSLHELITMASIVELEGSNSDDRRGVAGVFYNRLSAGWSLGSDVTTYYAAQIEMSERDLTQTELDDANDYNTRSVTMAGKLPVGPICNSSLQSIIAAIQPEEHDYFYFVADKNMNTYFTKTYDEHVSVINDLKNKGLWYTYG